MASSKSDRKAEKKTEERRDAGITRMLNTPPKPHKDMKKGKAAAQAEATQRASAKRSKSDG